MLTSNLSKNGTSLSAVLHCENDERKDVGAKGVEAKTSRGHWTRLNCDTGAAVTVFPETSVTVAVGNLSC